MTEAGLSLPRAKGFIGVTQQAIRRVVASDAAPAQAVLCMAICRSHSYEEAQNNLAGLSRAGRTSKGACALWGGNG